MSKLSDPRAEKERDYTHQRVIVAEYPHLWVKAKRKKKQGTQRAYRRKVKQVLLEQTPLEDTLEHRLPETVRREPDYRHSGGTQSLGAALEGKFKQRANAVAFNLFKNPYDPEKHRARFAAMLEALLTSSGEKAFVREVALRFQKYLYPKSEMGYRSLREFYQRHNRWLEAFFKDEPTLKPQLEAWIATVLERD